MADWRFHANHDVLFHSDLFSVIGKGSLLKRRKISV